MQYHVIRVVFNHDGGHRKDRIVAARQALEQGAAYSLIGSAWRETAMEPRKKGSIEHEQCPCIRIRPSLVAYPVEPTGRI